VRSDSPTPLSLEQLAEAASWLEEMGDAVPESLRTIVQQHGELVEALSGTKYKLSRTLRRLRQALGIVAQSERRRSGRVLDQIPPEEEQGPEQPEGKRSRLERRLARHCWLEKWHQKLARKQRRKSKAVKKKLSALPPEEEEFSQAEEEEIAREVEEQMARYGLGGGPDPSLQPASETLMVGAQEAAAERQVPLKVPEETLGQYGKVLDTIVEQRQRYDFSFVVTRMEVQVEKKVVLDAEGERRVVSASTADLGPPGSSVTWGFLAHVIMLAVHYALPFNRLGKLLSTPDKKFTAGTLGRLVHYVAERFVAVYLALSDELAESAILVGDDTPSRVVEVAQYLAQKTPEKPPPWEAYRNREQAVASAVHQALQGEDDTLATLIAAELGFAFERRDGAGPKRAFNTTVVAGRSVPELPQSLIVFYRSHLGGLGNLLEMLLAKRRPEAGALIVQSDLATVNLVTDPELLKQFPLRYAGCMSHARRPFALHEDDDPELCEMILHQFKGIALKEQGLDLHGRNRENVLTVRQTDSRPLWEEIRRLAKLMTPRWSASTELGRAARYIVRHYDTLTAYLTEPQLHMSNNFAERMLRPEKLIQRASLFRKTLEGRFALDVLRTIIQTAVAAGVPPEKYLLWVLRADPDEVADEPERFTPLSYAAQCSSSRSD